MFNTNILFKTLQNIATNSLKSCRYLYATSVNNQSKVLFSAFCLSIVARKSSDLWAEVQFRCRYCFKYTSNEKSGDKRFSLMFDFESYSRNVQTGFTKPQKVHLMDTVALTHDLPSQGLYRGQVGNIVDLIDEDRSYRVRFITPEGRDYASMILQQDQLMVLHFRPDLYI
jgi:hypothetical protein